MKRIVSIGLLSFLLVNVAGFYLYSYFRFMEIRREMRAELLRTSPDLFEKITLGRNEYEQAREGNDELEWNGKMYDITSLKVDGDSVEILALADEDETNLLLLVRKLLHSSTSDSKSTPSSLVQYLTLTFTLPYFSSPDPARTFVTLNHLTPYLTWESDLHNEIVSPPPQG